MTVLRMLVTEQDPTELIAMVDKGANSSSDQPPYDPATLEERLAQMVHPAVLLQSAEAYTRNHLVCLSAAFNIYCWRAISGEETQQVRTPRAGVRAYAN